MAISTWVENYSADLFSSSYFHNDSGHPVFVSVLFKKFSLPSWFIRILGSDCSYLTCLYIVLRCLLTDVCVCVWFRRMMHTSFVSFFSYSKICSAPIIHCPIFLTYTCWVFPQLGMLDIYVSQDPMRKRVTFLSIQNKGNLTHGWRWGAGPERQPGLETAKSVTTWKLEVRERGMDYWNLGSQLS